MDVLHTEASALEKGIEEADNPFVSAAAFSARCIFYESCTSEVVCVTDNTIHAKQYLCLRPLANKYHEGMVKQDSVKRGNTV